MSPSSAFAEGGTPEVAATPAYSLQLHAAGPTDLVEDSQCTRRKALKAQSRTT